MTEEEVVLLEAPPSTQQAESSTTTTKNLTSNEDEEELSAEEYEEDEQRVKVVANDAAAEPERSFPAHIERQRQRVLRRRVARAIDEEAMQNVCIANDLDFARYGTLTTISGQPKGADFYIYKDNGSDILAVAHLDSVEEDKRFFYVADDTQHGDIVCSPTLDDRLGCYVILELLPKLGINCDILLTVGEERGQSTAQHFTPPEGKRYNWMFQFDRAGADVVLYQYDTEQRRKLLRSVKATPATGAFSDIGFMGHVGCAGFNWGVGYHDYHSTRAWASLHELTLQVARFWRFHDRYKDVHMKHAGVRGMADRGYGLHSLPRSIATWSGTSYDRWRVANGMQPYSKNGNGKKQEGNGASNGARPFRTNVIPEIDDQLKRRKRGSRRGKRYQRERAVNINGIEFGAGDAFYILDGRCPVCNTPLFDDQTGSTYCGSCNWDAATGLSATDHVLSMTDDEYRRYERLAERIRHEEMSLD